MIAKDLALLATRGRAGRALLARRQAPAAARGGAPSSTSTCDDELDLVREAANASQLRRNFADSPLLMVPEVYWDFCTSDVMVMERMHGMPIVADRSAARSRASTSRTLGARRRGDLLHAGLPRRLLPRRHAPGQHPRRHRRRARALHRARLRHHGHAHRRRQELPRAQLPRLLPPRLPARRAGAPRGGLGAARHARRRVRGRDPRACASRSSTGR